jgi:hypothetical protein
MFPLVKVPTNNSLGSTKGIIERKKKRERNLEKKGIQIMPRHEESIHITEGTLRHAANLYSEQRICR